MTTYAVGHLRRVTMGPAIIEYLRAIDATLAPFGGRFLVHGAPPRVLEGAWEGDLIVIAFPDRSHAQGWYDSPAYRRILPLRTAHAEGEVILVDGVPDGHRATDILASDPGASDPGASDLGATDRATTAGRVAG